MKVILSREAIEDLVSISQYIAEYNPERARTFLAELQSKFFELGEAPLAYQKLLHRTNPDIRRRPHGNYLIFYRVLDTSVEIIHVLHGAQDYVNILFPKD